MTNTSGQEQLCFYALGDWGNPSCTMKRVAKTMALRAPLYRPEFILGLGDNFYPFGVETTEDTQFRDSWEDVFLCYKGLRIPWKICLGNHDYMGDPEAQIRFTSSQNNPGGLWQCPAKNFIFSHKLQGTSESEISVDFFVLDTNGCQGHVQRSHPRTKEELSHNIAFLEKAVAKSSATWKIVCGHHPMYTRGRRHGVLARLLRDAAQNGYALEAALKRSGAHAYFSGHEHVFQHHNSCGIDHFVCGASGAEHTGFYGGESQQENLDWVDARHAPGFVAVNISASRLKVDFIGVDGSIMHTVERYKHPRAPSRQE
ncbi:hypothetical protein CYMTET_35248 [Cymbomonas tetramitiformis]|uniref:Calcineurin-like phosphoesterase domain-containing protein n=1 Tax=Cymbomonas tetramitiformis TaxID=36881 RepID=A0AAE0KPD2_9CHLO|nr:hypothetical protein CYMTET_35248 [Cymbomonas tetramitiformis]